MSARLVQTAFLFSLLIMISSLSVAQGQDSPRKRKSSRLVSRVEGIAIAQSALQRWPALRDKPDCSHLVHQVYGEAGLDYEYAPTDDIFEGIEPFQRVWNPQPGDLIVWKGHVGIVIDPEEHSFYSSVISGFSVSSYNSAYWESRGPHRFYRYRISPAQSAQLLRDSGNSAR